MRQNTVATTLLCAALAAPAAAKLGAYDFSAGGGKSSDNANQHFHNTGTGIAVGATSGNGITIRHGALVVAARARDETPPVIVRPGNRVVPTQADTCTGIVNFPAVEVSDNRDRNPRVTVTLLSNPEEDIDPGGEQVEVALGSYDVRIVATDRYGNRSQVIYRLDVVDRTAPTVEPLPDPTPVGNEAEAESPVGTRVLLPYGCVDACDQSPTGSRNPAVARFRLGDTRVVFSCVDDAGNTGTGEAIVRVRDTTPPRLQAALPDGIEAQCQTPDGAVFDVPDVAWIDNGSQADALVLGLVVDPGTPNEQVHAQIPDQLQLRKGVHVLRYTAVDENDNAASADLQVTISDNGVPEIEIVEAPQNGWFAAAGDHSVVIRVRDGCAPPDRPLQVSVIPQADDIVVDGNEVTLTYRAEGLYRLQITVADEDGNEASDNSIGFGIDTRGPAAVVTIPSQRGVNDQDEDTFPIFARAENLPLNVGGVDDGDGITSGIGNVTAVLDEGDLDRNLADHDFAGDGVPPRGPRVVANVACETQVVQVGGANVRDGVCNRDTEMSLRHVPRGIHTIAVTAADQAGNTGSTEAVIITADLADGLPRVNTKLLAAIQGAPQPVAAQVGQAILAFRDAASIATLQDDDSPYDSPIFLGGALRKVQTGIIRLSTAIDLANGELRTTLRDLTRLALKLAWSDVTLTLDYAAGLDRAGAPQFFRDAYETDADRTELALDLVLENLQNEEWNQAAANVLLALFHAKSALSGWIMDYHYVPEALAFDLVFDEYERGRDILQSIVDELSLYGRLDARPAENEMTQIRDRLASVVDVLDRLVLNGFIEVDANENGITDRAYADALRRLQDVANFSAIAANNGAWTRNYQWSMLQVVRFMTQASMENAIASQGANRRAWPIYDTGLAYVSQGVEQLDDREIQATIELYGENVVVKCLIYAVYHCDFTFDEGVQDVDTPYRDADIPDACGAYMHFPSTWPDLPDVERRPPRCQFYPDGDAQAARDAAMQ